MLNVWTCLQEMFNWLIIWANKAYWGLGARQDNNVLPPFLQAPFDAAENVEIVLQRVLGLVLDHADLYLRIRMFAKFFTAQTHHRSQTSTSTNG